MHNVPKGMYGSIATAKSMPAAGVGTTGITGSHHWSLGLTALVEILALWSLLLWTLLSAAGTATRLVPAGSLDPGAGPARIPLY